MLLCLFCSLFAASVLALLSLKHVHIFITLSAVCSVSPFHFDRNDAFPYSRSASNCALFNVVSRSLLNPSCCRLYGYVLEPRMGSKIQSLIFWALLFLLIIVSLLYRYSKYETSQSRFPLFLSMTSRFCVVCCLRSTEDSSSSSARPTTVRPVGLGLGDARFRKQAQS